MQDKIQDKENPVKVSIRRAIIFKNFLLAGLKVTVLKPYWRNKEVVRVLLLSAAINLVMWGYLFSHRRVGSDYPIILHYNLFFGVDALGNYDKVFLLPLAGVIMLLLNAILGQFFYKIERLASYMLTLNILVVQVILMLSSYLIVRVNG